MVYYQYMLTIHLTINPNILPRLAQIKSRPTHNRYLLLTSLERVMWSFLQVFYDITPLPPGAKPHKRDRRARSASGTLSHLLSRSAPGGGDIFQWEIMWVPLFFLEHWTERTNDVTILIPTQIEFFAEKIIPSPPPFFDALLAPILLVIIPWKCHKNNLHIL